MLWYVWENLCIWLFWKKKLFKSVLFYVIYVFYKNIEIVFLIWIYFLNEKIYDFRVWLSGEVVKYVYFVFVGRGLLV